MRITKIIPLAAVLVPVLALTACGSDADTPEEVADEAAEAMAEGPMPQPGQYRTTATLLEFTMPGAPPEAADMLRGAFAEGAAEPTTYCLTPEQAQTSREDMLKNMAESNCTVSSFSMEGGRIDAALSCPAGEGVSGDVTMHGTMSETGSDIEMTFTAPAPANATIKMHMVSERVGECS